MKVGILSMQRIKNWGSFLQAFALKGTIEELGHECSFLDIKQNVGLADSEVLSNDKSRPLFLIRLSNLFSYILKGQLLSCLRGKAYQKKFNQKYNEEFLPLLGIDKDSYECDKAFDLVVIGSDEVFNCTQTKSYWGRTLHLFGEGIEAKKIITYAGSFGKTTLDSLEDCNLTDQISNALKNISNISVRDENSYSIIENLTDKKPVMSIDPAMIFDFSPFLPENMPIKDYLIVYTYQGRITDPDTIKTIKDYAVSKNKKIVSLYCYYSWCDYSLVADTPFQLLAYFANADYVVTDTFHGSVFSMIYKRNFCTILRETNTQKIDFLLNQFKQRSRIVKAPSDIKSLLDQGVDYSETNKILTDEAMKAKDYLRQAISL